MAPTRFEDLFKSPPQVIKGSSVVSVNDFKAEVKQKEKKDPVTERLFMEIPFLSDLMRGKSHRSGRENLKNKLVIKNILFFSGGKSKRPPPRRPRPFSKLPPSQVPPFPTTTVGTLIVASGGTALPPPPQPNVIPLKASTTAVSPTPTTSLPPNVLNEIRNLSVTEQMKAARNRLRTLMGQEPIGVGSTTVRPTPQRGRGGSKRPKGN